MLPDRHDAVISAAAEHGATTAGHDLDALHADIAYYAGAEHKAPARLDDRIWDGLLAKHTIAAADAVALRID
ncbi:hypothetical protein HQ346_25435 [Rhodococcus sp. BP-252]|uniref:Uncharacterized protein n=1 Tax=Rhodococcoides kyotonense TaxID=398843 RepID=A0A177YE65_9NOCA|nr:MULTISPECIES: hypothetical protein [Rhodococcus]MBY6414896.1 hypothetical protein [Rhodococcus sp. BP-320]MBY6419865.1 hypothetical protein [Rhodococcus sp. BP-321]MBY6424828.1 hypothetical protein [Rhodococcus sp. BP-324]MBY6429792.1 hypothetical protein [Rhodococcus sp. BP-323]MBY6434753.1 hypothetical protein [Rhodococcus sp. BP-322]